MLPFSKIVVVALEAFAPYLILAVIFLGNFLTNKFTLLQTNSFLYRSLTLPKIILLFFSSISITYKGFEKLIPNPFL